MSAAEATIERILNLAADLQPKEQAQLISRLATVMEKSVPVAEAKSRPSLYGALADLGAAPSVEDIDEIRREMWANFPRDDF
jgi:hypothetical protein